jgi:hypothetical protein
VSIRITGEDMCGTVTGHTARQAGDGWAVSWLPGRTLTRNQAITALTIAEASAAGPGDRIWPHIEGWAAELGLSSREAAARAAESPQVTAPRPEPEAGI